MVTDTTYLIKGGLTQALRVGVTPYSEMRVVYSMALRSMSKVLPST